MSLTEEEKRRRVIDLHFRQHKPIRDVSRIMGKSSHDITPVTKEYRIRLTQNHGLINKGQNKDAQGVYDRVIPNVQAYKLFSKGNTVCRVEEAKQPKASPLEFINDTFNPTEKIGKQLTSISERLDKLTSLQFDNIYANRNRGGLNLAANQS
jgi:hypothetical protein